jgi:hypothetical protein
MSPSPVPFRPVPTSAARGVSPSPTSALDDQRGQRVTGTNAGSDRAAGAPAPDGLEPKWLSAIDAATD